MCVCIRDELEKIYEVGSALRDRPATSHGLSSVLRAAAAIFPRDFRETANQPAISQEVPCKPTTGVRAFAEWDAFTGSAFWAEDSFVLEQFGSPRVKYSYAACVPAC